MAENAVASTKPCSRREFIGRSGYAVAGTMLASQAAIAVDTAPKKIRIGVVGGGFGASFQWHERPDCVVQAVSDLREDRRDRLMNVYNCPTAYNSLEELVLAGDIDAVAIFIDGPLHVQHTIEAMKNGKHVISAVPAAWAAIEQAELLPEPLRHDSGHEGSHTFLTHEFVDAVVHDRRPAVDIYESLAYTVPGIVAHQSALKEGELLKVHQYDRSV